MLLVVVVYSGPIHLYIPLFFSILEIYNEKIRDLLVNVPKKNERKSLRVREHPDTGPYVEGQFQFYCRGF